MFRSICFVLFVSFITTFLFQQFAQGIEIDGNRRESTEDTYSPLRSFFEQRDKHYYQRHHSSVQSFHSPEEDLVTNYQTFSESNDQGLDNVQTPIHGQHKSKLLNKWLSSNRIDPEDQRQPLNKSNSFLRGSRMSIGTVRSAVTNFAPTFVRRSSVICSSFKDHQTADLEKYPYRAVDCVETPSYAQLLREDNFTQHLVNMSSAQSTNLTSSSVVLYESKMNENNNGVYAEEIIEDDYKGELADSASGSRHKRDLVIESAKLQKRLPLVKKGVYDNPWSSWTAMNFKNIYKFFTTRSNSSIPCSKELDVVLPILEPVVISESPENAIRTTWIGHSTVMIQFENVTILTDPIFSQRASPSQWFGPKRYRSPALTVDQLPNSLCAVLISHAHYDHLDLNSVRDLHKRYGDRITWFVGLGLKKWFSDLGIKNVIELNWWEENRLPDAEHIRVVFLPAQHHSRRTLNDNQKMLWGSWAVIGDRFRFYTAGDTGYNNESFKEIGQIYGPFDLAALPIGAYEPNSILRYQHINPEEAVQIHQEIRSKFSMAIHWGTFDLSKEYYLEPPVRLRESLEKQSLSNDSFIIFKHGEARLVYANGTSTQERPKNLSTSLNK